VVLGRAVQRNLDLAHVQPVDQLLGHGPAQGQLVLLGRHEEFCLDQLVQGCLGQAVEGPVLQPGPYVLADQQGRPFPHAEEDALDPAAAHLIRDRPGSHMIAGELVGRVHSGISSRIRVQGSGFRVQGVTNGQPVLNPEP
jgi:hypothetical protein